MLHLSAREQVAGQVSCQPFARFQELEEHLAELFAKETQHVKSRLACRLVEEMWCVPRLLTQMTSHTTGVKLEEIVDLYPTSPKVLEADVAAKMGVEVKKP